MSESNPPTRFSPALIATGACVLAYAVILAVLAVMSSNVSGDEKLARTPLVVSSVVAGVVYVAGLWRSRRHAHVGTRGVLVILLVGLAARGIVLVTPPFLETDYHRYLLDGAVTARGANPYSVIPDRLLADDVTGGPRAEVLAEVATSGRPTIERINHSHLATIYPPGAQAVFAIAHLIEPWSIYAFRAVLLVFDVATAVLLLMLLRELRQPLAWIVWYWWNPVLLREVTSSAHMDVIVFPFIVGAILLAIRGRGFYCSIALVVAVGMKLWPILLAPALLRAGVRRTAALLGASAVLVAGSVLILSPMIAGASGDEAGLRVFSGYWRNNEGFFAIWSYVMNALSSRLSISGDDVTRLTRLGVAFFVGCWAVFGGIRPIVDGRDLVARVLSVVAALFLLGPTQFPWYYLWMLPLLCVRLNFALLLYTATLPLYYVHCEHRWVLWVEHLPIWAVLIGGWIWSRKGRHADADARVI